MRIDRNSGSSPRLSLRRTAKDQRQAKDQRSKNRKNSRSRYLTESQSDHGAHRFDSHYSTDSPRFVHKISEKV